MALTNVTIGTIADFCGVGATAVLILLLTIEAAVTA